VMQTGSKNEQPKTEAVVEDKADKTSVDDKGPVEDPKKTAAPEDPNKPVDLTPQKIPGDPNQPLDLSSGSNAVANTPPTQTPPTQTPPTPTQPVQTPPTQPAQTTTPPGELPKLTDPSTTAPDAETLARKQAEEAAAKEAAAKEAEKKKTAARVQTPPRQGTRRDRGDAEEDDPPKRAKLDEMGFLRVKAYPSGWVSVDGGPKKAAPTSLQLTPGKHRVKIFTDFESKVRTVEIEPGEVKIINVDWDSNEIQEN
jgi:hypothetical protein